MGTAITEIVDFHKADTLGTFNVRKDLLSSAYFQIWSQISVWFPFAKHETSYLFVYQQDYKEIGTWAAWL